MSLIVVCKAFSKHDFFAVRFTTIAGKCVSKGVNANCMLTKKKIIVIIGIIVALLITFYTGVFGIAIAA